MNEELLSRKELIETGHEYDDLEMEEPPSDRLLVPGEDFEEGTPVTGLVYALDEKDGPLLYYGEYEEGLPQGISADFHRNGQPERVCRIFRGAINGRTRMGFRGATRLPRRVCLWGPRPVHAEPAPDLFGLIESQIGYYENRE